jgi:hypothetical protein
MAGVKTSDRPAKSNYTSVSAALNNMAEECSGEFRNVRSALIAIRVQLENVSVKKPNSERSNDRAAKRTASKNV